MNYAAVLSEEPVECKWGSCGMKFSNSRLALNHVRREHDLKESNGKCLWINCPFQKAGSNLRNHVKRHFDIVEALCEVCPVIKSFKWRFDLSKHLRQTHSSGEEFTIDRLTVDGFDVFIAKPRRSLGNASIPSSLQKILN